MRMSDVIPGDIVNKNHTSSTGWFVVKELQELPNDGIVLAADSDRDSINGMIFDMVGLQVTKVVEIPADRRAA